ncbi:hypothetical protein D9M71_789060 [compost metagenome]
MGTAAQPLLIHDNGHAQVLDRVRFRLRNARQEIAHEHAEVLVQQSRGFRGDRIEDDRRLAGSGYPGEDRDLLLGNAQGYVLEIVFPRTRDYNMLLIRFAHA